MSKFLLIILLFFTIGLTSFTPNKSILLLIVNNDDEQELVTSIITTLQQAEKVSQILDIELLHDEMVEDIYIFNIRSTEEKNLTIQLFDEEGFDIVGHNELDVYNGNNYRVLNVESLRDGTYIFKISDQNGDEYLKRIEVTNK